MFNIPGRISIGLLFIGLLFGLTGCATPPPAPEWQAVAPMAIARRSAYYGGMTKAQACDILDDAIRVRHEQSKKLQLTSLSITPEHFKYGSIVWGDDKVGWNPKKSIAIDIAWSSITSIGVNRKHTGAGDLYSILFKFNTDTSRRVFMIGSCEYSRYSPADVLLALEILTGRQPAVAEPQPTPTPIAASARMTAAASAARPEPSANHTVEDKLLRLKQLHDKGLISDTVYEERQRELLKTLP